MQEKINVEWNILDEMIKYHVPATVITINGFQAKGTIVMHDSYVIVIRYEGRDQIMYKTAISTIIPGKALKFINDFNKTEK